MVKTFFHIGLLWLLSLATAYGQTPPAETRTAEGEVVESPAPDLAISEPPALWEVCNETSYLLNVAVMTTPVGGNASQARVRGWKKLRSGQCKPVDTKLGTPRFAYARSDPIHKGGIQEWRGDHTYCIDAKDFVADIDLNCGLQNLKPAAFLRVLPTEQMTRFVEPSRYKTKAATAGLQRLLRDNGYKVSRIDGVDGRRTQNSLNAFLKAQGLKSNISVDAKFAALEKVAGENADKFGVEFCNHSSYKIWTALAVDEGDWWRSEGWWPIGPDECVRPFNQSLKQIGVYYYARQEFPDGDDKEIYVLPKDKSVRKFCVASSTFSAITHEYCADYGYSPATFKPMPTTETGKTVIFTDASFLEAIVSDLR